MASNIVSETIDAAYPIAGVDNDSQGFRDNFSVIKNSLAAAKQEVEDLQLNSAKLNEANNFAGNNVIEANLKAVTEEFFQASGTVQASQNINFDNGHYQKFGISAGPIDLTFDNWPASNSYGKIRIELYKGVTDSNTYLVTFKSLDSNGGTGVVKYSNWPTPVEQGTDADQLEINSDTDPVVIEAWTTDGGATVYAHYIGKFAAI